MTDAVRVAPHHSMLSWLHIIVVLGLAVLVHIYPCITQKIGKKKWRELQMKVTHKHKETWMKYFNDYRCLLDQNSVNVSFTFTLFWSRKEFAIAKIFHLSFRVIVFVCDFHPQISSFFGKSFPFLILFFVLSVLRYLPFHMIFLQ